MDELTQKGLEYINNHSGILAGFAREQVVISRANKQFDDWIMYDATRHGVWGEQSLLDNCVDINVWLPDDLEDIQENWRATACPLERNSAGEIQTHTATFVELF